MSKVQLSPEAATAPSANDDQSDRATPAPRKWERIIGGTGRLIETCPPECEDSHATDKVDMSIDDLCHGYYFSGPELPVFDAETGTALVPILAGRVQTDPYNANPDRRRPHLNFEPFQDEIMEGLTPNEFAQVIATVRAHCDELEKQHAKFAALYTQWTEDQA